MDDEYEYELGFKHRDCEVCEYDVADCYYNGFCQWEGRMRRQSQDEEQLTVEEILINKQQNKF